MSSAESACLSRTGEAACPAALTATCHSLHAQDRSRACPVNGRSSVGVRCDSTRHCSVKVKRSDACSSRTLPHVARVVVNVMLKPEIHDPQGEAIASACQRLGFGDVLGIRQGKRFEVEVAGTADERLLARVGELAGELLANPVIEEFTFHEA